MNRRLFLLPDPSCDFGDKRGVYTPSWWKLEGSQYGKLKTWRVGANGTYIDGVRISDKTIAALDLRRRQEDAAAARLGQAEARFHELSEAFSAAEAAGTIPTIPLAVARRAARGIRTL